MSWLIDRMLLLKTGTYLLDSDSDAYLNMTLRVKGFLIVIMVTVILAHMVDSFRYPVLSSSDLPLLGVMVAKDINPDYFVKDYMFSDDDYYRFYTPSYRWLVAQFWKATGSFELALVWLVPFILGVYLIGMFWLMYRLLSDIWLALGLTIASANYYKTIGAENWGVAGIDQMIPRTIFTAFAPFLFMGLFALLRNPSLLLSTLLGVGVGLSANLHPTSGLHLALIVVGLLLLAHGTKRQGWLSLVTLLVGTVVGAAPMILHYFSNTDRSPLSEVTFKEFSAVFRQYVEMPFHPPQIYWSMMNLIFERPLLDWLVWGGIALALLALVLYGWGHRYRPQILPWLWLVGGLVAVSYGFLLTRFNLTLFFWVAILYVIYRFWKKDFDQLDVWLITMLGLIALLSFVGRYFMVWAWETFEIWALSAPIIQQARAARFIFVPIYILVGRAGLCLAFELRDRWRITKPLDQTGITIAIGLGLSLGGVISRLYIDDFLLALLAFAGGITLTVGLARLFSGSWHRKLETVSPLLFGVVFIFVIFGPLASLIQPYFPVPTSNMWQAGALTFGLHHYVHDNQLYNWIQTSTSSDALFYPCGDFSDRDLLQLRYRTGRSITHARKDLNLAMFDGASLVAFDKRYQELGEACQDPYLAITTGRELKVDFILVPAVADPGADISSEFICFANDKYKVLALDISGCNPVESRPK